MDELINEVLSYEPTKSKWRNNYDSIEWRTANKLNIQLFKMPLNQSSGCQCLEDLFFYIKRVNFKENFKIMSTKKFKIKDGKLLMAHGFPPMSNNTPDEEFIKMLKYEPSLISALEVYPDNWKEIVFGKGEKSIEEIEEVYEGNDEKLDESVVDDLGIEIVEGEKELSEMSIKELQDICTSKGIKFHHKSKEAKLIELINNAL